MKKKKWKKKSQCLTGMFTFIKESLSGKLHLYAVNIQSNEKATQTVCNFPKLTFKAWKERTQLTFTYLKSTKDTLEKGVK